jgi:hypothetical protein
MSSVSSASWLSTQTAASNWVQSAVTTSNSANWLDPSSAQDPVDAAANAFAAAEQTNASYTSQNAVNTGMSVLQSELSGQSVNILA